MKKHISSIETQNTTRYWPGKMVQVLGLKIVQKSGLKWPFWSLEPPADSPKANQGPSIFKRKRRKYDYGISGNKKINQVKEPTGQ